MTLHDLLKSPLWRYAACVALLCTAVFFPGCPELAELGGRVFVSDVTPGVRVLSVTGNRVALADSGPATALRAGDIVASEKDGVLRRVTGWRRVGVTVVADTEEARVEDAVKRGYCAKDIVFTSDDFRNAGLLPRDETVTLLEFDHLRLFAGHGVDVSIEQLTLGISPELTVAAYYSEYELRRFSLLFEGKFDLDAALRVGVDQGTYVLSEEDLMPPVDHPFVMRIGVLPVIGNARLRCVAGIEGNFDGDTSVRSTFGASTTFSVGGEFTRGEWERIAGFSPPSFRVSKPVWTAEVGANVVFYIALETEVSFFSVVQGDLRVSPFLRMHTEVYPAPFVSILDGGFTARGACSARLFDWQLLDESFEYVSPYCELGYYSSDGM